MFAKGVVGRDSEGCLQRAWWDGVVRGVCKGRGVVDGVFAKGVVGRDSEGCLQRAWWDGVVRGVCKGRGGMG